MTPKIRIDIKQIGNAFIVSFDVLTILKFSDSAQNHVGKYLDREILTTNVVNNHLVRSDPYNRIVYTIDRSMTTKAQRGLNDYCEQKIDYLKNQRDRNMNVITKIDHANSVLNPALQIADYISGAAYAKYEYGNAQYYNEIKSLLTYKDK